MNARARIRAAYLPRFETFSTQGLPARRKTAYWNQLLSSVVASASFEPADAQRFAAELTRIKIGDVWLVEVRTEAGHLRFPASKAPLPFGPMWSLQLVLEGECTERQWGREARLKAGDFALHTSASLQPYEATNRVPMRILLLTMPRHVLRRYLPCPEEVAAIAMAGDRGVSGFASGLLRHYWSRCRAESVAVMHPQVIHGILEIVASAYTSRPEAGGLAPSATSHRARAVSFIESHLREPDLAPGRVASALQMTTRNLHYAFSHQRETVHQYIVRRRLEESAQVLISPAPRRTMSAIALDFGFCNASQYGRAFRRIFGMTPSAYRRRHRSGEPLVLTRAAPRR